MRHSNTACPRLEPLEARSLLSGAHVAQPDGFFGPIHAELKEEPPPPPPPPIIIPPPEPPPKIGGVSVQTGAVVEIDVGQPSGNTVQVNDEGAGAYQASWNGGPVHSFTGVQQVTVLGAGGKTCAVTINVPDLPAAAPAIESLARRAGKKGSAVQTGNEVKVAVTNPAVNTVQIFDQGGGAIEVAWNGGADQLFHGVATILVHAQNAKKDQITFDTPPLA